MTFFSDFFLCISTVTVCIKCVSCKGKKLSTNKYTNTGKRRFNLNREANYRPQCAFDDSAEGNVCLSIFLFTGIPVTIYSTLELSDRVVVLGLPLKI